jgi:hypothetical protein
MKTRSELKMLTKSISMHTQNTHCRFRLNLLQKRIHNQHTSEQNSQPTTQIIRNEEKQTSSLLSEGEKREGNSSSSAASTPKKKVHFQMRGYLKKQGVKGLIKAWHMRW